MASSNLAQVLTFEGHRLHAFKRAGSDLLWFVLADLCKLFGIGNPAMVAGRLEDDQKGISTIDTPSGRQQMLIISEDAAYAIGLTSRKPFAKRFARWLYRDVLPEIRRTGSYQGSTLPLDALIGELQSALDLGPSAEVIPLKVVKSETPQPVSKFHYHYPDDDAPINNANPDDEIIESESRARGWARNREDAAPFDYWTIGQWHIRRRIDLTELWVTTGDASTPYNEKRWLIPRPNGKLMLFYCNSPPPIEIALLAYDSLGPGPDVPTAIATLRHHLAD